MSEFELNIGKGRFILAKKHKFFLKKFSRLKCAEFCNKTLVMGYADGHYFMRRIEGDEIIEI